MKFFVVFLSLVFLVVTSHAQKTESERLFIPKKNQASFQQKLETLVDCYRQHNWGCVYDLSFQPRVPRAEFINKIGENLFWRLEDLVDVRVLLTGKYVESIDGAESWFPLEGCIKFRKSKNGMISLNAYLVKDNWYFSSPIPYSMGRGIPDQSCKLEEYSR